MYCSIYRSTARQDTYLFVPHADDFEAVPAALLERLGGLELALELELSPERRLARTTGARVIHHIETDGYYLQLPPEPPAVP
jgi:uncharacterized protein YcgL (UPF0745 family)